MLNIKLINRLICLEQVVDAMFKDDAPDIAEALKVCINIIFGTSGAIISMVFCDDSNRFKACQYR